MWTLQPSKTPHASTLAEGVGCALMRIREPIIHFLVKKLKHEEVQPALTGSALGLGKLRSLGGHSQLCGQHSREVIAHHFWKHCVFSRGNIPILHTSLFITLLKYY